MVPPANRGRLLADAIRYALGSLDYVQPRFLPRPTPCAAWDLAALLQHVNDSLAALHEGIATGQVSLGPPAEAVGDRAGGLIATCRARAGQLLAASATSSPERGIAIADRRLTTSDVTAVGAVEVAVHGWDVAQACGSRQPIPPALATGILEIVPLVATSTTRELCFAAPVTVSPLASPGDLLIALLGRDPQGRIAAQTR